MKVRLDHINMSVTNLEESIQWYKNVFGFEKVEGGISPNGLKFSIVALNDNMLALYEAGDKEKAEPLLSEPKHQIFHFGLRVDNLDEWLEKIEKFNIQIGYGDVIQYPHSRSWYITDPSGHEIEVSWANNEALKFQA